MQICRSDAEVQRECRGAEMVLRFKVQRRR